MKYEITKLEIINGQFVRSTIKTFSSSTKAIMALNKMGHENNWKFQMDQSLFQGYWADADGVSYEVR